MSNNHQLTTPLLESENSGGDDFVVAGDNGGAQHPSSSLDLNDDFESHFTQRIPISTVLNFRGSKLRVIDTDHDQIILQQQVDGTSTSTTTTDKDKKNNHPNKNNKVLVKRLSPATYTNRFLRVGYTLITILLLGFLFVFSLQVLLFLFISLPVDAGYAASSSDHVNMPAEEGGDVTTEDSGGGGAQVHVLSIVNTILSFPIMLYGLASLMAMGSAFVVDTYNGASIFRSIFIESIYMLVYLIIPSPGCTFMGCRYTGFRLLKPLLTYLPSLPMM